MLVQEIIIERNVSGAIEYVKSQIWGHCRVGIEGIKIGAE